ncbi:MbtH family protein [Streptomyces sp. FL07-04A]|uniref:MbtH family protein n=1 Tax=Streptomyces sp. FL07-04A TaxID=3028658 RepID=UPI0029A8CCC8|nr:MbtH family protein [Streptomyces sp. FL07-04A]MDX3578135.1 MbtH family protein [Streptomyces sp. FL07-04A]
MSNPFDDPDGTFAVLVNAESHHCLWPAFADVPAGWTVAHPPGSRKECLAYVARHWPDQRPASLTRSAS